MYRRVTTVMNRGCPMIAMVLGGAGLSRHDR